MSALGAARVWNVRITPRKRTLQGASWMSAKGQKRRSRAAKLATLASLVSVSVTSAAGA